MEGQGALYLTLNQGCDYLFGPDDIFYPNNNSGDEQLIKVTGISDTSTINIHSGEKHEMEVKAKPVKDIANYLQSSLQECISFCRSKDISDPIEILKEEQKFIIQGQPLKIYAESETIDGERNCLLINRQVILKSTFEEEIAIYTNPCTTLEISLYGEVAEDLGGPRKEFLNMNGPVPQFFSHDTLGQIFKGKDDIQSIKYLGWIR
eukprot:gene1599-1768_t